MPVDVRNVATAMAIEAAPPSTSAPHFAKVLGIELLVLVAEAGFAASVRGRVFTATAEVDSPGDNEGLCTTGCGGCGLFFAEATPHHTADVTASATDQ